MSSVEANDFENFFFELHGFSPFPWQKRLARQVCEEGWPKVIDLPTASGKTACIDIALFALAVRGNEAPRRIFFVVDRRVIVSEAFERAEGIAKRLKDPKGEVVPRVAHELKHLAREDCPLETYELRGGAFRDETWVRSPLQPIVVASTVDQVGSRLLFRGYGISQYTWSLHAGLIANDAIIFLDEAHCSKAFAKTLSAVEQYRGGQWAPDSLARPFHFVEMTATPNREIHPAQHFTIDAEDRSNQVFKQRILASKPTRLLEPVKCKKDDVHKFAAALISQATTLADQVDAKRVAIMVNRISTAKEVYRQLSKAQQNALLVIGRMRPLDRDSLAKKWEPFKSGKSRSADAPRTFVVSTQCLEVGADLDFDVIVSECASIDALLQRFGRLDRIGDFQNARGAILVGTWQLAGKSGDPVYGEALSKTWTRLESMASDRLVDMAIESIDPGHKTVAEHLKTLSENDRNDLSLQSEEAPFLLPAHLDALAQTSPQPEPEPLIDYFLHGPKRGRPDLYVVWRSDLVGLDRERWKDVVALCPPVSLEAMPVPLWAFRNWFEGKVTTDEADVEVMAQAEKGENEASEQKRLALIWRGLDEAFLAKKAADFRPGDTVALPSSGQEWDIFGFKPPDCPIDRGDEARLGQKKRFCLRLHPRILEESWPASPDRENLRELISRPDSDEKDVWNALREYRKEVRPEIFKPIWGRLDGGTLSTYPAGSGWILEGYYGEKESRTQKETLLGDHTRHVENAVDQVIGDLLSPALIRALKLTARYHDYGKADLRFQAWLRNGDSMAARYAPKPLAKSGKMVLRPQTDCGLPEGFRHELLSFMFAAKAADMNIESRDLILHLIASHHGRCRPFAPIAIDERPECVEFDGISLCRRERLENPPYALNSGVADRFWALTRQYGWWGLAYLEAMFRLADWSASDSEKGEVLK